MSAFRTTRESVGLFGLPQSNSGPKPAADDPSPGVGGDESERHYSTNEAAIATIWLTLLVLIIAVPVLTTALSGALDIVANR